MTKKKKVLIVYPNMMIGGSTTSLLSFLLSIDHSKNNVDLLLGYNEGPLFRYLPKYVNVLPQAHKYSNSFERIRIALKHPRIIFSVVFCRIRAFFSGNKLLAVQRLAYEKIKLDRILENEYDIAISYLEFWATAYVSMYVKAKKKVAWFHMDYKSININPKVDLESYRNFDKIVLISKEAKKSFDHSFPSLKKRSIVIENIISKDLILQKSKTKIDFYVNKEKINLVTTCRIDFSSKALDRSVKQIYLFKLSKKTVNIVWYIIGNGPDYNSLYRMIRKFGLKNEIVLLGEKVNPFPYMKQMDAFFLPSKYEGKPVSVTEAIYLGLPPIVTDYSAAREQVIDGFNGIVIDNNEESIYKTLCSINDGEVELEFFKNNLVKSQTEENFISVFESL